MTATVPRRRPVSGVVLIAAIAGLVVGGGGVGLGWWLTSSAGDTGTRSDVQTACDLVGRVGVLAKGSPDNPADEARLTAAAALTDAAAHADGGYTSLNDAVKRAANDVGMYTVNYARINDMVVQSKAACASQ